MTDAQRKAMEQAIEALKPFCDGDTPDNDAPECHVAKAKDAIAALCTQLDAPADPAQGAQQADRSVKEILSTLRNTEDEKSLTFSAKEMRTALNLYNTYKDLFEKVKAQPSPEPVAKHWIVHRVAKGQPLQPDYALPAGFFDLKSAESCMAEQIDFHGWRDAWIEPLYAASQPSAQDSGK